MSDKTITANDIMKLSEQAQELLDGKEFFVGTVADRLQKAAANYPHDQAIRTMQAVMEKRFKTEGSLAIISQREFQDLYEQVSGLGQREAFSEQLGDLLHTARNPNVAHYNEDYVRGLRGNEFDDDFGRADPSKVAEFAGLFGEPIDDLHRSAFVESGRKGVEIELLSMGFENPAVEVATRNDHFVIFAAEVDTALGRAPLLVPAEIKLGSVLLPSVFVSGNEFQDFTRENILNHAAGLRENKRLATPTAVLNTLNKLAGVNDAHHVKTASQEEVDSVVANFDSPGLYSELVEEPAGPDFSYQQVEMPEPLKGLSEDFVQETLLEAGLSFSRDAVVKAKMMLETELRGMGLSNDKIVIASEWPQGVILATNIMGRDGKKTIQVPVEIVNNRTVLMPNTFTSGTVVKAFTEANLTAFAHDSAEGTFEAIFSDKRDMSFNQLYNGALEAAAHGNFVEVEESLAVIGERFGPQFHKIAFDDLMELVRIGFNSNEPSPLEAIDAYIKEAAEKIPHKEQGVKINQNLLMLYPEDDR